ncbi:MAG TPA: heat-inducible transcriptional repressor HrcA [Syntrophomonadaceae bacterium]|nr:heat-inducible transcriptional repressor HrcA [Syntrophomonadaceae bacterium]
MDERKKLILESIIKDYVETAEPVGSRAVVKKHNLKISAATVRNEMSDLEEMGFLEQPHTSSGRIPSELGFRYYVDCMMEKESLSHNESEVLQNLLGDGKQEWSTVVERVGHFLSQVTNYASFIIIPPFGLSEFRYLQLLPLEPGKAVMFLVSDMGMILHNKIDIPESVKEEDLRSISQIFNQILRKRRIGDVRRSEMQELRDTLKRRRRVIDQALEAIEHMLENSGEERVVISGALNILNEPEFKDLERIKRILSILEEESLLRHVLPDYIGDEVDIRIGKENQEERMKEMSLVFTGYKGFGDMGKIGLMGPVRMEYGKAAGAIESVRRAVEELLKRF